MRLGKMQPSAWKGTEKVGKPRKEKPVDLVVVTFESNRIRIAGELLSLHLSQTPVGGFLIAQSRRLGERWQAIQGATGHINNP